MLFKYSFFNGLPKILTGKYLDFAQNVWPIDIYRWGGYGVPAYPPQGKEDINEEDSLMCRIYIVFMGLEQGLCTIKWATLKIGLSFAYVTVTNLIDIIDSKNVILVVLTEHLLNSTLKPCQGWGRQFEPGFPLQFLN